MKKISSKNYLKTIYLLQKTIYRDLDIANINEKLYLATKTITRTLKADSCTIKTIENNILIFKAFYGIDKKTVKKLQNEESKCYFDNFIKKGKVVIEENIPATGKCKDCFLINNQKHISCLAVPLKLKNKIVGSITVYTFYKKHFFKKEVKLLKDIASLIAMVIETSRLLKEINKELNFMKTFLNNTTNAIICLNQENKITLWNKTAEIMFGWKEEEVFNSNLPIIRTEDLDSHKKILNELLNNGKNIIALERQYQTKNGELIEAEVSTFPVQDENNKIIGTIGIIKNLTTEKKLSYLKEINNAKSQFISTITHELKQPLTNIKGFTELVLYKENNEEKKKHYLEIVSNESNRMLKMIQDLHDLSNIELGKIKLQKEKINMNELIQAHISNKKILSKIHKLKTSLTKNQLYTHIDKNRIIQVIDNLLNNAMKYSPDGGEIIITTKNYFEDNLNYILVSIKDEGLGIQESDLNNIFKTFYRIEEHRMKNISGTGLGLSVCKSIIDLHQGKIWVESQEDKGSTFHFALPLTQSANNN